MKVDLIIASKSPILLRKTREGTERIELNEGTVPRAIQSHRDRSRFSVRPGRRRERLGGAEITPSEIARHGFGQKYPSLASGSYFSRVAAIFTAASSASLNDDVLCMHAGAYVAAALASRKYRSACARNKA